MVTLTLFTTRYQRKMSALRQQEILPRVLLSLLRAQFVFWYHNKLIRQQFLNNTLRNLVPLKRDKKSIIPLTQ